MRNFCVIFILCSAMSFNISAQKNVYLPHKYLSQGIGVSQGVFDAVVAYQIWMDYYRNGGAYAHRANYRNNKHVFSIHLKGDSILQAKSYIDLHVKRNVI